MSNEMPADEKIAHGYLKAAQKTVLAKAIVYARLKTFGTFINHKGQVERYSLQDEKDHTEYALEDLGRAAVVLLQEMTLQVDGTTPPEEL